VLDECRAAGIPVLAADIGALGERTRELGAGWTFAEAKAGGLATSLLSILENTACPAPERPPTATWSPRMAAEAHRRLHETLVEARPAT
jgi:hypothetical protein